jgi:hypothetical protein
MGSSLRGVILTLSAVFFSVAIVLAICSVTSRFASASGIAITPEIHEFGKVRPGILKATFILSNPSPSEISLIDAIKSCGCTEVEFARRTIPPYGKTNLSCEFNVRGRVGEFSTTIAVLYRRTDLNSPQPATLYCGAHADVDAFVHLSPTVLTFTSGTAANKTFSIQIKSGHGKATGVESKHKAFAASLSPDGTIVTVSFDPQLWHDAYGHADVELTTTCTDETRILIPLIVTNSASALGPSASFDTQHPDKLSLQ